jgi:hypothetical protein
MNNFLRNKKNLLIVAGAGISLAILIGFIYVKISTFKEARNKQQIIVNDPHITSETKKREYSEVSRESAAGIFAGRDSLRVSTSSSAPERSAGGIEAGTAAATTTAQSALPQLVNSGGSTAKKGNDNKRTKNNSRPMPTNTDTIVKTALEQRMEQIEAKAAVSHIPKKPVEHKEPPKPVVNLTVVKSRKPSVYSTYKEDPMTTHDNVILFSAKVYGLQKVKTNETVTFRNTETVVANGHVIAPGSIFRGVAKMSGNRMNIDVTSAVSREGRYSVKMSTYDNDFVKGIFVKEVSEIAEENVSSSSDAVINIATSAVPVGSVVKSASKEAAKQTQRALKKQEKITITLEDGYEVYLAIPSK